MHEMTVLREIVFLRNRPLHLFGEWLEILLKVMNEICSK
jgi:hypothetical protein